MSGDSNPIHLWAWSARLLGFKRPIIHGMHTVARATAALQQAAGRRVSALDIQFLKPIALPGDVTVHAQDHQFDVWASGVRAVSGTVKFE